MVTVAEVAIRCNLRIRERHSDPKGLLSKLFWNDHKIASQYVVSMWFFAKMTFNKIFNFVGPLFCPSIKY